MKKSFVALLSAFVILGALAVSPFVPKLVAADTFIIPNTSTNCGGFSYSGTSCAPGVLHVYVQVSTAYQNNTQYQPNNFTVTVTSLNASPISFSGSQSGTNLSVVGQYAVTANSLSGYTPTYSVGCNGSVISGGEATCVITESANAANYFPTPVVYPYQYAPSVLSCTPSYQTVGLNQSATFSATGSYTGAFNWMTPNRSYQAIGPTFTTTFPSTGTQVVTVWSGTQSATCTVDVVAGAVPVNYVSPGYVPPAYVPPSAPTLPPYYNTAPASITSNYVPSLPNTGYGPLTTSQVAAILGILGALGIFLAPYVRKTLVAIG